MTKQTIDLLIKIGLEVVEWASVILRDKKKGNGTKKKSPGNQSKKS